MRNRILSATIGLVTLLPATAALAGDFTRAPHFNWQPIRMPAPVFANSSRVTAALRAPAMKAVPAPERAVAPAVKTASVRTVPVRTAAWASGASTVPAHPIDRAAAAQAYQQGNWFYGHLHYAQALDWYQAAIDADPTMDLAYYQRGNVLSALRRFPEAVTAYKQAIARKIRFDSYNSLGLANGDMGQLSPAINAFKTAIKLAAGQRMHLANAYYNLGNVEPPATAITAYRTSLKYDPRDPKVYDALGGALMALGRYNEAVVAYRQEVRLNPKPQDHRLASMKLQYAVAAVQHPGTVVASNNRTAVTPMAAHEMPPVKGIATATTIEADALRVSGNYDQAIKTYLDAIASQPQDEAAYTGLAQAADLARQAGSSDNQQLAKAYLVLGDHMLAQDKVAAAVASYQAALQLAPDSQEAALHLEQARSRMHQ